MIKPVDFQIFIKGAFVSVDLDRSASFSFNLQTSDLIRPTAVRIPFSAQIPLPRTQRNDSIFSSIFKIDSVILNYNPLKRTDFLLYVGGTIFQSGYFTMEEVTNKAYKIRLYGGLGDFFYTMNEVTENERDMRLSKLNFGDLFNHKINKSTVLNHWKNDDSVEGTFYDYSAGGKVTEPVLKYAMTYQGKYDNFDSDSTTGDSSQPVEVTWEVDKKKYSSPDLNEHYRSFKATYGIPYFGEYRSYYQRPAVRFKAIYNKILETMALPENGGWETVLDKTFFNAYNPYWNDLWLICPQYDVSDQSNNMIEIKIQNNKRLPASVPSSGNLSSDYYHWYGKSVNNGQTSMLTTTDVIKAYTEYTIAYHISFTIDAIYVTRGKGLPQKEMKMNGNSSLIAYLVIGTKEFPLVIEQAGGSVIFLNTNTVGNKTPLNFSPTPGWNDDTRLQPFEYNYLFNGGSPNPNTTEGTTFTMKGVITTTELGVFLTPPDKAGIKFVFNGNTYWFRQTSGDNNDDRHYGVQIRVDEENSYIGVIDNATAGLRSYANITYKNIIRSEETCFNFLISYGKIFGLHYIKDQVRKKVTILTRNSFFAHHEKIDWTHKIDYSKEDSTQLVPFEYTTGIFKWNDTGSKYEEVYLGSTSKEYGSARFNTGYELSDAVKDYLDGIIFDNCIIATDYSPYYLDRDSILYKDNKTLPYLQDSSGSMIKSSFIPVFYNGLSQPLSVQFAISDDTPAMLTYGYSWTNENITACNTYPLFSKLIENNGEQYSLNFGRPSEVYNENEIPGDTTTQGTETIYSRFWRAYLQDRFSENNRVKTCYVYLDPTDIQSNLFNKFIYINNTVWVLHKIYGYNPLSSGPTKVELIKVQNINSYISQNYVAGNLIIRDSSGNVIYDASGMDNTPSGNPVVIRIQDSVKRVGLTLQSSIVDWSVDSNRLPAGVTVTPLSGDAGIQTPVLITLPEDTTGSSSYLIPVQWGDTTTLIQVVSVSNWTVTATSNIGTATINGLESPQSVYDGTTVTFACTGVDGYRIGYWMINGVYYYSSTVSLQVFEDMAAEAFWFDASNYVILVCHDPHTSIPNESKINNYWLLTAGNTYTFTNSQFNLSGYLFAGDAAYTSPSASIHRNIPATDTLLTVYYDTLLANIEVVNHSGSTFSLSNIIVSYPDGSAADTISGSVSAGTTNHVFYKLASTVFGTYSISVKGSENYKYGIDVPSWNYSRGSVIPSIVVTLENPDPVGWAKSTLTTYERTVVNDLYVPSGATFQVTSNLSGVDITPHVGIGSQTISFALPENTGSDRTITVTALITGIAYTFQIIQQNVLNYIYWEKSSLSVPVEGGTLTNVLSMPSGYEYSNLDISIDGVAYEPNSGTGTTRITFTVPEHTEPRIITVSASISLTDTLIVVRTFEIDQA